MAFKGLRLWRELSGDSLRLLRCTKGWVTTLVGTSKLVELFSHGKADTGFGKLWTGLWNTDRLWKGADFQHRTFVTFVSTAFSEVGKEDLTRSQKGGRGKLQPVRSNSSWAAEGTQWGIAECCRPEHSSLGKGPQIMKTPTRYSEILWAAEMRAEEDQLLETAVGMCSALRGASQSKPAILKTKVSSNPVLTPALFLKIDIVDTLLKYLALVVNSIIRR